MTYEDIIKHFKTNSAAADALNVTRSCLSVWKYRGIPLGRQALIQIQTRGRLKAEPEFRV